MPPVYLDCAASAPIDPRVREAMRPYLDDEPGNAGSRTHQYGQRARAAAERARDQIAVVVAASRGDIIFTSGATESNNLALLGLAPSAAGRTHIVATAIEHHAVLEPLEELQRRGFEVTLVNPQPSGVVRTEDVLEAVRPDTLLVSTMHVNNETGVIQPIAAIADGLANADVYFHVDAAQSFARELTALQHPRIDLVSVSGHKIGGPKGIGALVTRRRNGQRPPLQPLFFGGGQERGLRPGTLPVALVVGLGAAAEVATREQADRASRCRRFRTALLDGLAALEPVVIGDAEQSVPYILSAAFPGLDAETVIEMWSEHVAISIGAACSTQTRVCSHVLAAMRLPAWQRDGAVRFSWMDQTPEPDWDAMVNAVLPYRQIPERAAT